MRSSASMAYAAALTAVVVVAESQHPVRDSIVEEIKLKATSWKPKAASENHLRHRSLDSIKASMGHLGVSPKFAPTDFLSTIAHTASDFFKQITATFGHETT